MIQRVRGDARIHTRRIHLRSMGFNKPLPLFPFILAVNPGSFILVVTIFIYPHCYSSFFQSSFFHSSCRHFLSSLPLPRFFYVPAVAIFNHSYPIPLTLFSFPKQEVAAEKVAEDIEMVLSR